MLETLLQMEGDGGGLMWEVEGEAPTSTWDSHFLIGEPEAVSIRYTTQNYLEYFCQQEHWPVLGFDDERCRFQ